MSDPSSFLFNFYLIFINKLLTNCLTIVIIMATKQQEVRKMKLDRVNTEITLNDEEIVFFNDTVARVENALNISIPIYILDHEQLKGKSKEALGICWTTGTGEDRVFEFITIDEFFVSECFLNHKYGDGATLTEEDLEHVICHELAHAVHWRHGKRHTELMETLYEMVKSEGENSQEETKAEKDEKKTRKMNEVGGIVEFGEYKAKLPRGFYGPDQDGLYTSSRNVKYALVQYGWKDVTICLETVYSKRVKRIELEIV